MSAWTNEALLVRFRYLVESGHFSFSQIATELNREFGTCLTKYSCIGRAHRQNIQLPPHRRRSPPDGKPRNYPILRKSPRGPTIRLWATATPATPETDQGIPLHQRKHLIDLEPADCRYPVGHVGEPGFFFCGGQVVDGLCYCAAHARVCYEPARPRKLDGIQPFRRAA
jgi:hypothetical protein